MRIIRLGCLLLLTGFTCVAQVKTVHRAVEWMLGGTHFRSVLVYDDASTAKRPGLVMVPKWYGVNDVAIKNVEMIVGKDYVILLTACTAFQISSLRHVTYGCSWTTPTKRRPRSSRCMRIVRRCASGSTRLWHG